MKNGISVSIQQRFAGENVFLLGLVSLGSYQVIPKGKRVKNTIYDNDGEELYEQSYNIDKKVYKPLVVSTGLSLPSHSAFWDREKKRAKGPYSYINDDMDNFITYVHDLHTSMVETSHGDFDVMKFKRLIKEHISEKLKAKNKGIKSGGKVTKPGISKSKKTPKNDAIRISLPKYFGNEVNGIKTNFIDYIQYRIDEYKKEGPYLSDKDEGTIKVYNKLRNKLIEYKEDTGIEYDVTTFNQKSKKEILSWMMHRKKENGEPYAQSYVEWLGKEIRNFLMKAKQVDKIPIDMEGSDVGNKLAWKRSRAKSPDPYLTLEMLDKLKSLKFGNKSKKEIEKIKSKDLEFVEESTLEHVRNMFIVNCGCGYRWSDFHLIKHLYKIDGKYYFQNTSEKTNTPTKIPVRDKWIISLYENTYKKEFDVRYTDQLYNRAIKVLGFRAGFTHPVSFSRLNLVVNKREPYDKPFYQCMFTKTARKTFTSLEVKEYLTPLTTLVEWGGWSSEATLRNYLQLTADDYTKIGERTFEIMQRAMKSI